MILLWVKLLVLHGGYALVPVKTVYLDEPATFVCDLPDAVLSNRKIHWYKQGAGDILKLIVKLWKSTVEYAPEFSKLRFKVNIDKNFSNLTILRTIQEDEGMYHCAQTEWIDTEWSGTYLIVEANTQRTSNYTVVQRLTVSDPVRSGDLMTLQCSVLSDSENKTCPGDRKVYWFKTRSNQSHPNILYTDGNRHDECDKRSDTQENCVYHFSKTVSPSDAGTYYCAVATCGKILFGNGTKVEIVPTTHSVFIAMAILIICLVISLIGNVVLICNRKVRQYKGTESATSEARHDSLCRPVRDIADTEDKLNYAALGFSEKKTTRGRKRGEFYEDSVYSSIAC